MPMPLSPDIAEQLLAACRRNAAEIAVALALALEGPCELDADKIEAADFSAATPEGNGPGLVVALQADAAAALAFIPESSGLLPAWISAPDAGQNGKLAALALELGGKLLPAESPATQCRAGYVENFNAALARAGMGATAGAIQCVLRSGETSAALRLVWPATSADAVFARPSTSSVEAPPIPPPAAAVPKAPADLEAGLEKMPSYIHSLLQISVPVSVLLASTKQPVSRILNIGPGSIIQFDKNCEKPITLCVGNQPVAEGEAVKVGEKFGMKLTAMILPGEKFIPLQGKRRNQA